jgi:drug/metabolite transporter (DMT)-like permease
LTAVEEETAVHAAAGRPSQARLYTMVGFMILFWSLNYTIGKIALREFPGLLLAGLRTTMAGFIMLAVYAWHRGAGTRACRLDIRVEASNAGKLSLSAWATLLTLGLLGVVLNQVLFVLGLNRTSVAHASILASVGPIMVLLIAAWIGQERLTVGKLGGMGIAVAGVTILQASSGNGSGATVLGDLLISLGSLAFAGFAVLGKRYTRIHDTVIVNAFAYVGGAVMLAPITIWKSAGFHFAHVSAAAWLSLTYMAVFPSVVCYLIFYYVMTYITASRASAFSYLQPVVATLVAIPVLGEHVTALVAAGGALTLAGVYVTERK